MMALAFTDIMINVLVGLLVSSPFSSGMSIKPTGEPLFPSAQPRGSPGSPSPPDGYFEGSGGYPMMHEDQGSTLSENSWGKHPMPTDGYPTPMVDDPLSFKGYGSSPDARSMPYDAYPMHLQIDENSMYFNNPKMPFDEGSGDYSLPGSPPALSDKNQRSLMYPPDGSNMTGPDPYCDMLLQQLVPPALSQIPWYCICSQCKRGTLGPKGVRGDRGLPGPPGSPGRKGLTGSPGPRGFTGHLGLKGQKGDDGEKGNQGNMGFSGMKGGRGFKGDKGDMGMTGQSGERGPIGEPGECPATCESVQGPPGESGLPGRAGARGLPGVAGAPGPMGMKGGHGEMGPPGPAGARGLKGDQGVEGECHCTDGEKGDHGHEGLRGSKGDKGDMGPQGTQGPTGQLGHKGDMGMMGVPGPCSPTIQSAFSATLGAIYPAPNAPVPFMRVLYNMQFNFDPNEGTYRAPVNGTYVFSFHLIAFGKTLRVGLYHNFLPVVKTIQSSQLGTASQQVVLHLSMGDGVWLQVKDTDSNGMYESSEASSTFSGFLLHPDSCDQPLSRDFPQPFYGTYSWGDLPAPPP